VGLKKTKPGKTGPGQNPKSRAQEKTEPPPPRKKPRVTGGRDRDSGFDDSDKEGGGEHTNEEDVRCKNPTGKRRMHDMHRSGREFEIRRKRFSAQKNA
jgi:hypothetical protein